MQYLVDGYNLIGKLKSISYKDPNKEDKLIEYLLKNYPDKWDLTVVFDGHNKELPFQTTYKPGRIRLVFTASDESADSYIINFCKRESKKSTLMVVSSDRDIQQKVKAHGVAYINSADFIAKSTSKLNKSAKPSRHIHPKEVDFWLNQFSDDET